MSNDQALREQIVNLLTKDMAHLTFDAAVADAPVAKRGRRAAGMPHSPWEILEHMRIAQWDILEFTRDGKHVSPKFPDGYWPASPEPPDDEAWSKSVAAFRADRAALVEIARTAPDLYAAIPHGDGQTVLRELLLAADHNAYHLGQLVLALRA